MKRLKEEIRQFLLCRSYCLLLTLTAAGCYGFKLMHQTIGIDDTPYEYYFSEGLVVVVGRWVLFLLNRFLDIGTFAPFLTDFAAVLLMMTAAVLWSVVFARIFGEAVPKWGYLAFACLFISNPLISEVFTYFLHNGIAIGYTCSALGILAYMEGLDRGADSVKAVKWGVRMRRLAPYGAAALCVWAAVGCYESFAVVFLVMGFVVLQARRIAGQKDRPVVSVLWIVLVLAAAVLLRSLMTNLLIAVFSLQDLRGEAVRRSLSEMLGWITDAEGRAFIHMQIKRAIVMYGVFAYHYLPISMYTAACAGFVLYTLWSMVRKRDIWIFFYMIGAFAASYILIFIEGKVTLYRACQFLPLFSAAVFLLLIRAVWGILRREKEVGNTVRRKAGHILRRAAALLCMAAAAAAVWNQTADMNKWFYVDYRKYEAARETMHQIALELEKNCDISKPLVFIGTYEVPMELIQDAYVPIGSEKFFRMNRITSMIDEHLLEKYYRRNQIWVAQTPALSVIQWGMDAFDSNEQLIRFMKMHGHSFVASADTELAQKVTMENLDMPAWPEAGSIREEENYIIINFGF